MHVGRSIRGLYTWPRKFPWRAGLVATLGIGMRCATPQDTGATAGSTGQQVSTNAEHSKNQSDTDEASITEDTHAESSTPSEGTSSVTPTDSDASTDSDTSDGQSDSASTLTSLTSSEDESSGADTDESSSSGDDCDGSKTGHLDEYHTDGPAISAIATGPDNLSGIAWHPGRASYFVILDNGSGDRILELDPSLNDLRRDIAIVSDTHDFEAIAYLGADEFALVNESNRLLLVTIDDETKQVGSDAQILQFAAEPANPNEGAEGIAYDPDRGAHGRFWATIEKNPARVLVFDRPADDRDHSYLDDLQVELAFSSSELGVDELADASFDPQTGFVLVLSQEHNRILELDPDCRIVLGELQTPTESLGFPAKWEAITVGPDATLMVGGESFGAAFNRAQRFAR